MASLDIVAAGPLVSIQDIGRRGHARHGVARSGPMDRMAHAAANVALGRTAGAAAIEVSAGGVTLDLVGGPVTVAVTGDDAALEIDGDHAGSWCIRTIDDCRLRVVPGRRTSWAYLAFTATPVADEWLGSFATHTTSGLGGATLRAGSALQLCEVAARPDRDGEIAPPPGPLQSATDATPIRVVIGPQGQFVTRDSVTTLLTATYRTTAASNRMGTRLDGPPLTLVDAMSIPSSPVVRGSIQVAGDGVPTVLHADHQTTGGYPRVATVVSADLDRVARAVPGDPIRFAAVDPDDAIQLARSTDAANRRYLADLDGPARHLARRLATENLIDGVGSLTDDG
ncbi:MAG: biotin-dependent carboxyltransferase family protein [Actinomycetota bacterium]